MQKSSEGGQLTLFDLDTSFGKMCPAPSPVENPRAKTSGASWNKSSKLKYAAYQSLDLTPGAGNLLGEFFWETLSPWRGDASMLNTGVSPREEKESSLSQILEAAPQKKYYLSKTACLGILRRARERGKQLPEKLRQALEIQADLWPSDEQPTPLEPCRINQRDEPMQSFVARADGAVPEGFDGYNGDLTGSVTSTLGTNCGMSTGRNGIISPSAFAVNQRDEARDLHDLAGALGARPGMKQQTFIAEGGKRQEPDGLPHAAAFSAGQGAKAGGIGYQEECAPTLKASESGTNMVPSVLCLNDQGGKTMACTVDKTGTLRAQEHGHQPLVYENHGIDSRYTGPHKVSPTMSARYGTGGNNIPLVEQESTYCITGNSIDRQPQNGGNGLGCQENIAYTLTATDRHAVYSRQRVDLFEENQVTSTESARQYKDATDLVMDVAGLDCRNGKEHGDLCGTLQQGTTGSSLNSIHPLRNGQLIRRLTPLECERLQGFPDGWTDIEGAADSARYRALGNSVAIPCVEYVLQGIAQALRAAASK